MTSNTRIPQRAAVLSAAVVAVLGAHARAAETTLEEIVVTGSHILQQGQANALPIRVLSVDDVRLSGAPALLEIIRAMPEVAGSLGNANSSQAGKGQGTEGAENINLRGLGADRNLVLLNGKRMPLLGGAWVNTRLLPWSAIDRMEVLKDSAASTYGSDAMTGVVNFITKRNVEGFEIGGDYTFIEDSDGDYKLDATWGKVADRWNVMLSGGYQETSALSVRDRDWSAPDYLVNPDAGWNFSANPSAFTPVGPIGANGVLAPTAGRQIDAGCRTLGSTVVRFGTTDFCINNVQRYQDLVNPTRTYQTYGEFNLQISEDMDLHVEATYSKSLATVDYPPSFNQPKPLTETVLPANINPAGWQAGTSPRLFGNWYVPLENPGLAAYAAANPAQFPANTTGVFIPVGQWRPYLLGGNPFFGKGLDNSSFQRRDQEQYRLSAGLTGKFGGSIDWDANVTWGQNSHYLLGWDQTGVETQLALRGLGGPDCDWQTAAPGSAGCLWLNPMSTAIPGAPINGVATNPGYVASTANDNPELYNWLYRPQERFIQGTTTEVNYVLNGGLESFKLGGGAVQWAAGLQYRRLSFEEHNSEYADRTKVPCLNSPLDIPNADVCTPTPYTPLGLSVAFFPTAIDSDIYAVFGEAMLPFTDRSNVTVGGRYEDYGSNGGSTFSPQLRGKWQVLDWMALRASASTSFRAPPQSSLAPNPVGSIPNINGRPTALDTIGNPDLEPEEATVFSVGMLFQAGNFDAALDYYHYDITDILATEPQNAIVNALFPPGAPNNCATLDPAFIAAHFEFSGECSAANLSKVKLLRINGPDANFDGLDLRVTYRFDDVMGGALTLQAVGNKTLGFEFDPFTVAGLQIAGFEAVGYLNAGTLAYTLPEDKWSGFVNYNRGPVNARWSVRYNSAYTDQRRLAAPGTVVFPEGATGNLIDQEIGSTTLHDFAAVIDLPRSVSLTLAVSNIFDEEPEQVRLPEGYDAMTADLLGRNYRLGLRMKF
jgi:iron complex outermembrane recepter protein